MVQMSQWYRLHGCYRRRLCKKADNPDDGVVNVADNVIVILITIILIIVIINNYIIDIALGKLLLFRINFS
jgi:hypothetical protein